MAIYKTVTDILLRMVASGELTKKQTLDIRDAHENEKAEWRNKMIHLVSAAYDAGTKHSSYECDELIEDIRKGACDV